MSSLTDLKIKIESSKKIAIFSHTMPDADAFCSSLALKRLIEENYKHKKKKVDIFIDMEDGVPPLYQPIVGDTPINEQSFKKYDLAIALDCTQIERLAKFESLFSSAKYTINIDHHESNTNFANMNLVFPKASSTGEILYNIAKKINFETSVDVAKNVFTSIITDTVCLTQNNVLKSTYKILAEISSMPIDTEEIKNYFFKTNTKAKIFLIEKALRSIKFYEDDKIAIMRLQKKDLDKLEATYEDTLGIIEHANNIDGIMIAGIIIENEPQKFYVSLRSKGEIKVSLIAEEFGGGGHSNMAAFQYEGEIKELTSKLSQLCIKTIQ